MLVAFVICKYADCDGQLSVDMVLSTVDIPRAPHYIGVTAQCWTCGRRGQYVVDRGRWEDAWDAAEEIEDALTIEQIVLASRVELDGVRDVDDVRNVWATLGPPLIEDHVGVCQCDECRRRIVYDA